MPPAGGELRVPKSKPQQKSAAPAVSATASVGGPAADAIPSSSGEQKHVVRASAAAIAAALDIQRKLQYGILFQNVLDLGRVHYAQKQCGYRCRALRYISERLTPKNTLLLGWRDSSTVTHSSTTAASSAAQAQPTASQPSAS